MYTVTYKRSAQRSLQRMPYKIAVRFIEAFKQLAANPKQTGLDVKPLTGNEGFRLRIGGWRAIYQVEQNRSIISVLEIGPRGDAYK